MRLATATLLCLAAFSLCGCFEGKQGEVGPPGVEGPRGPAGPKGAAGPDVGLRVVTPSAANQPAMCADSEVLVSATCMNSSRRVALVPTTINGMGAECRTTPQQPAAVVILCAKR